MQDDRGATRGGDLPGSATPPDSALAPDGRTPNCGPGTVSKGRQQRSEPEYTQQYADRLDAGQGIQTSLEGREARPKTAVATGSRGRSLSMFDSARYCTNTTGPTSDPTSMTA